MFGGARLAGDFGGALENYGVEIRNAACKLGTEAQRFVEFLDALVELRGTLEIEIGAGALAVVFDGGAERVAVGVEELHQALNLGVVFFFGASGKAGR